MATAISNFRTVENNYDPTLEGASDDELLRAALTGSRYALSIVNQKPQVVLAFTATVATASNVSIADLTALFGLLNPAARGIRILRADLYVGDLTEGAFSRSTHGVKNIGGTISLLAAASTRSEATDGGSSASQVGLDVSGTSVRLFTNGTWADDVYDCVCELYLPRPAGPVMSLV